LYHNDLLLIETGAVFTFGKCKFNDNLPGKFWLREDTVVCVSCGDEHTIIVSGNYHKTSNIICHRI